METRIFRAREEDAIRVHDIEEHPLRSKFQRDRDRILYSKEFRRLSGKTQVFIVGFDDHMRTRLTHTLEVSQIADTITRSLGLNEVLTEAIAYGHDVGHTPFGHVGERTLNAIMNGCRDIYGYNEKLDNNQKGFKHNWQGLRVVSELEQIDEKYKGLNLTKYTLWGILNHSSLNAKECKDYRQIKKNDKCKMTNRDKVCYLSGKLSFDFYKNENSMLDDTHDWTFEAGIVAAADEIAQRHHDIEDALHAGIIKIDEICHEFRNAFNFFIDEQIKSDLEKIIDNKESKFKTPMLSKFIVDFYTTNYIKQLKSKMSCIVEKFGLTTNEDYSSLKDVIHDFLLEEYDEKTIIKVLQFDSHIEKEIENFSLCDKRFQKHLTGIILKSELAQSMDGKSDFIIRQLFKAYLSNPQQLPDNTIVKAYERIWESKDIETDDWLNPKEIKPYMARNYVEEILKEENNSVNAIVLRTVCDFIAGMTDQFAMDQYDRLYGTQKFKNF